MYAPRPQALQEGAGKPGLHGRLATGQCNAASSFITLAVIIHDSSPPSFYINLSFGECPIIIGRNGDIATLTKGNAFPPVESREEEK
jgi:hypothetical protein